MRMHMSARRKQPEEDEEESVTLAALTVECDCVLDFYLERDSYDSIDTACKTITRFSQC